MLDEIAKLREELAKANGLYSECLRGNQALRRQAEEATREREEERCAASSLKLKLEGQIDDAVGVILRAKEQYRVAQDAKRIAEDEQLRAAAELDEANAWVCKLRAALEEAKFHLSHEARLIVEAALAPKAKEQTQ